MPLLTSRLYSLSNKKSLTSSQSPPALLGINFKTKSSMDFTIHNRLFSRAVRH
jgi:hypothetical protein